MKNTGYTVFEFQNAIRGENKLREYLAYAATSQKEIFGIGNMDGLHDPWIPPPLLSTLTGYPGVCQDTLLKQPFINCGLARKLVEKCMNSAIIAENGGVDVKENLIYKWQEVSGMEAHFDQIKKHCETVVSLTCATYNWEPENTPPDERCIHYFDIADDAGYPYVFTYRPFQSLFLRTKTAKEKFIGTLRKYPSNQDDDEIDNKFGRYWYFCRCKTNMEKKCQNLFKDKFEVE